MADLQKFLDQAGVSTLWSRVAEEVAKVDTKVSTNTQDITTMKGQIQALEENAYDDTEVRGLITANAESISENAADILTLEAAVGTLNGDVNTEGSVAHTATAITVAKIAEVVAKAPEDFDTLQEIAEWIANDTTGAAGMANDIAALERLVGDTAVATQISDAITAALKIEGVDKYALASELTALAGRVQTLENANYQNAEQVGSAIDAKIAALDLANTYDAKGAAANAETNAKAHADSLNTAMNTRVVALEGIDHDKILTDAKAYTDTEINTKIIALTEAEIDQAIANAKAAAQA